jgi:hypothetical protein
MRLGSIITSCFFADLEQAPTGADRVAPIQKKAIREVGLVLRKRLWYIPSMSFFNSMTAEMCCCAAMRCTQRHSGVRKWLS